MAFSFFLSGRPAGITQPPLVLLFVLSIYFYVDLLTWRGSFRSRRRLL